MLGAPKLHTQDSRNGDVNQGPVGVEDVGVFALRLGALESIDDVLVEGVGEKHHCVDDH